MGPFNITVDTADTEPVERVLQRDVNDAILIYSEIDGVLLNVAKDGEPSYTRDVSVWCDGFKSQAEIYTRLSQAVIEVIGGTKNKDVAKYNLINFMVFLINHSGNDDITIHVGEKYIKNTKEGAEDEKKQ